MQDQDRTPAALRAKAAEIRRAASQPTQGGWVEDQILIEIAEQLESEALRRETER